MNIKLRKNIKLYLGLLTMVLGSVAIFAAFAIIDKYGGPGINLTETNPGKALLGYFHTFIGLAMFMYGAFYGVLGFFDKSLYKVRIDGKRVKYVGAIKLKTDSVLDKAAMRTNILNCGFTEFCQDVFSKVKKGSAQIFLFGNPNPDNIPDLLADIRRECFFTNAAVMCMEFKQRVQKEDIEFLALRSATRTQSQAGVYICNAVFENCTQFLYTDAKIFTRYIFGKISAFSTFGMIKALKGNASDKKSKDGKPEIVLPEQSQYKLANSKFAYLTILIGSLLGLIVLLIGIVCFITNQLDAGIGLTVCGVVIFLPFILIALSIKRTVIISAENITEKKLFRQPFLISTDKAKWHMRGVMTPNGVFNAIVIVSDYVFDSKEMASPQNCKGKYIILKDTEFNKKVVTKFLGEETKL